MYHNLNVQDRKEKVKHNKWETSNVSWKNTQEPHRHVEAG